MSPETRTFLAEVRAAEDPTPSDARRVLAGIDAALAGSLDRAASGATASSTGRVLSGASGLKLFGALIGISAGVALAVAVMRRSPVPPRVGTATRAVAGARATLSVPPMPAAPSASARTTSERPHAGSSAPVGAPGRELDVRPQTSRVPNAAERAGARSERPGARSVREELLLLADVHAALDRGDGASALRRLDTHRTDDRQFVAERAAARVLTLCALGRLEEARRLAGVFVGEHPGSVQRGAVERSCAGVKSDGGR